MELQRLLCLVLLCCALGYATSPPSPTPAVHIASLDPDSVSVSGISSGADFAAQFHTAFSSTVSGVCIFAGQAPHCAVQLFPNESPEKGSSKSVPYCDGCPNGTTLGYDHCKKHPEIINASILSRRAAQQAASGSIDPLHYLQAPSQRVYLYRGTHDTTYNKGSVNGTANFYRNLMDPATINTQLYFETRIDSGHLGGLLVHMYTFVRLYVCMHVCMCMSMCIISYQYLALTRDSAKRKASKDAITTVQASA